MSSDDKLKRIGVYSRLREKEYEHSISNIAAHNPENEWNNDCVFEQPR
jgi:hypothetical protein